MSLVPPRAEHFSDSLALSREDIVDRGFAVAGQSAANYRSTSPAKEREDFSESPAQRYIEDLPPTPNPPRARDVSRNVPALLQEAAPFVAAVATPTWTALGPFPIPNGQTENRTDPVSGRVTAIAVHPTNANIAYVGTAQGGLYRTLNGGTNWTQLMDNAPSTIVGSPLAIGAVTIDPRDATKVFVGTGEGNQSGDSFFGNGLYIITGADSAAPVINGPYNLSASSTDVFTGRSIVSIVVDPANDDNVFCATSTGVGGIVGTPFSALAPRGLYRSNNALAGVNGTGTPTFARISIAASEPNAIVTSAVIDPTNANVLLCALFSQSGSDTTGGIYRSTNALAVTPTFTLTQPLPDFTNVKLAIQRTGTVVTVYATADVNSGTLYKSTDGGATFVNNTKVDGFAGEQGFYDLAVAVDPTNANRISVGGNTSTNIFRYSTNGGTSFSSSVTGLHADVHAIAYAPSNPQIVYHGNDGGIWRSTNGGVAWTALNNASFSATQFSGIALHPTDAKFTLAGSQDNGTEELRSNGTFRRVDFGDGGYSLIDRNTTSTEDVPLYHTYYNQSDNLIGTARVFQNSCANEGDWEFRGAFNGAPDPTPVCDGSNGEILNGIVLTDNVLFYPPMVLGPGSPNTFYFGTDKLYRSTNEADTVTAASQLLDQTTSGTPPTGTPVSAIAISPQDDKVRIVGLTNGKIFATFTGSNVLLQIGGSGATNGSATTPAEPVGRILLDPNDKTVAYVAYGGFGTAAAPLSHVYRVTNLGALGQTPPGTVTFSAASSGLPDIPANALAIDPLGSVSGTSGSVYVGTDAGVYSSADQGASWSLYGSGFPHVSVFGLEIQAGARLIRAATHGRGLYEAPITGSSATPTPTPTPSPTATITPIPTPPITPTPTPTPPPPLETPTPTPSQTPTPSETPSPTPTASPTTTPSPGETPTPTPSPGETPTPTVSPTSTPTPSSSPGGMPAQAQNTSTRLRVQTGEQQGIGGLIIRGDAPKRILFRGLGPSLTQKGVQSVLADPTLELHAADGTLIGRNDNWRDNQQAEIQATGIPPSNDVESAIVVTLAPGNYTAILGGKAASSGVGLIEIYDLDSATMSQVVNLSTRGFVGASGNVIIGGFILGRNDGNAEILLRGLGPSLASGGVTGTLADPTLVLRDRDGNVLFANDNWQDDPDQKARIAASGIPPQDDRESAIAISLPPGNYTATLAGKVGATGVGSVEIYVR